MTEAKLGRLRGGIARSAVGRGMHRWRRTHAAGLPAWRVCPPGVSRAAAPVARRVRLLPYAAALRRGGSGAV